MGVLLMHILNHLLTIGEVLGEEVHGVPQVVTAPVLPVLDDAVEGHVQGAILVDDALGLASTLIALFRLPEAVGPQGEHGDVATEVAHLGDDTVGALAIHKVIVHAIAYLGVEGHAVGIVLKEGG